MVSTLPTLIPSPNMAVFRIEVRPTTGSKDPRGAALLLQAQVAGVSPPPTAIDTTAVYLVEGELDDHAVTRITKELLCDPVTEESHIGASSPHADSMVEVHPLPGVMDPDAQAVELAICHLLGVDVRVQTGNRYDFHGIAYPTAEEITRRCVANSVVHGVHSEPYHPSTFSHGHAIDASVPDVPITTLSDAELVSLSRSAHLFLELEEMHSIQSYYKKLNREPRRNRVRNTCANLVGALRSQNVESNNSLHRSRCNRSPQPRIA